MSKKKTNNRFDIIYQENNVNSSYKIIVDKHTGVQYLHSYNGTSGGMTPLLDREGKVVIDLDSVEIE